MRIGSISVKNHEILGTFSASFLDAKGNPYDTIIFAGENGSGKTALLNLLSLCFTIDPDNGSTENEWVEYDLHLTDEEFKIISTHSNLQGLLQRSYNCPILRVVKDSSKQKWHQISTTFHQGTSYHEGVNAANLNAPLSELPLYLFLDVKINFDSKPIANITTKELDDENVTRNRGNKDLATSITQLMVDIANSDAIDLQNWVLENPEKVPPKSVQSIRMGRFARAFQIMFPNRSFYKVDNFKGSKSILFRENGKTIPLQRFSSGEKQIVFRGGFILSNKTSNGGRVVFIDEPEISLHPRWQMEIMNYYKGLLKNENGDQICQLFVATHSPFIIHNNNRYNDKVIVIKKTSTGSVLVDDSHPEFVGRMVEEAFNIDFQTDKIVKNTVLVEGDLDEHYLVAAGETFTRSLNFEIRQIGIKSKKGGTGGDSILNKFKEVYSLHPQLLNAIVVLYYDNDCNVAPGDMGNLKIRSAPKDFQNTLFTKGIESLLILPADFNPDDFRKPEIILDGKGTEIVKKIFDKTRFCEWVLKHPDRKAVLSKVNDLLSELDEIFRPKE